MKELDKISGFQDHPLRHDLHHELHARPSLYFDAPANIWHVAILIDPADTDATEYLSALPGAQATQNGRHGFANLKRGRMKWERHTEFLSLTSIFPFEDERRGWPPEPPDFLELASNIPGKRIAAIQVVVIKDNEEEALGSMDFADFVASGVAGGDATVWSNFQLDDHGYVRLLLANRQLNAYRTGRMVRRLLEIETYRMMALLGLPLVRESTQKLAEFDGRLNALMDHMRSSTKMEKAVLSDVTRLSSDLINFMASARDRFGATAAYAELVTKRIAELREERIQSHQRLGIFIERRFRPAIRSCAVMERRLENLAARVARATDLLRTAVQVELEDQNASLLKSMEQRTRTQIQIQQAVEGFSIIAISYYILSLVKLCLESAVGVGLDAHLSKMIMLSTAPVLILVVWRIVSHVRKSINGKLLN